MGGFCGRGKRCWRIIEVTFLEGVDDGMGYDKRCILHERVWVGERRRAVVVVLEDGWWPGMRVGLDEVKYKCRDMISERRY